MTACSSEVCRREKIPEDRAKNGVYAVSCA